MDIAFTVEKVCKVFHTSSVQVVGVNAEELGLYLALNRAEAELRDVALLQFCPRRRTNRGRPPTITGCALDENKTKRFFTIRKMFTEAMKVVLLFIMENHMYTFNNEIKLQSRGGPIGLELIGVLAQLFMVLWDRQFVKKVEDNGLRLRVYKRYVDDINVIMNTPSYGLRFFDGKVIQDERVAELEKDVQADRRCVLLVQSIGNSIHSSTCLKSITLHSTEIENFPYST